MRVRFSQIWEINHGLLICDVVDYILFLTADVDVKANLNEIRDWKYVDKAELQAMFDEPCEHI